MSVRHIVIKNSKLDTQLSALATAMLAEAPTQAKYCVWAGGEVSEGWTVCDSWNGVKQVFNRTLTTPGKSVFVTRHNKVVLAAAMPRTGSATLIPPYKQPTKVIAGRKGLVPTPVSANDGQWGSRVQRLINGVKPVYPEVVRAISQAPLEAAHQSVAGRPTGSGSLAAEVAHLIANTPKGVPAGWTPKPNTNPKAVHECGKCQGIGWLSCYSHVEGGICFGCKGTGKSTMRWRTPVRGN